MPPKLAIVGNYDFSMDVPAFETKIAEVNPQLDLELVRKECSVQRELRKLH